MGQFEKALKEIKGKNSTRASKGPGELHYNVVFVTYDAFITHLRKELL